MKIGVVGLGNVGLVCAICLRDKGHEIVGVEISAQKVAQLKSGELYIFESGLRELFEKNKNKFVFTQSLEPLVDVDCVLVCVGTPPRIDGSVELRQLIDSVTQLSRIQFKNEKISLIIRSTLPPGTTRKKILPLIEKSKTKFSLFYCPEFLREGSAVCDFNDPSLSVLGVLSDDVDLNQIPEFIRSDSKLKITNLETAEMIKYMNNSFHALKVSFANEIGAIASQTGAKVNELFDLFLSDEKLNISRTYLKPGFCFGGPCLTKELKALKHFSDEYKVKTPLLESISESNDDHLRRAIHQIEELNPKNVLVFGLSFKPNTDDLRESPILELITRLQPISTYLNPVKTYVRDRPEVLQKIKAPFMVTVSETQVSEIPKDIDLVLFGPFAPTEADEHWLSSYTGNKLVLYPQGDRTVTNHMSMFNKG